MAQKELHTIMISRIRWGNGTENVQPKYFRLMHHILSASQYWWPFLTFPPVSLGPSLSSPLSLCSNGSSHGQEPHSQWVQHVPFQSLAVVIFQLAKCSPSCHSVTNGWSATFCTYAALFRRLRTLCQSLCLTLSFDTVVIYNLAVITTLGCMAIVAMISLHGSFFTYLYLYLSRANASLLHHLKIDSKKNRKNTILIDNIF